MRRLALLAGGLVVVGIAAIALLGASAEDPGAAGAAARGGAQAGVTLASARGGETIVDTRIDEIRTESDLLHYFDELEAEARARGHLDHELALADRAGKRLLGSMPGERVARRMFDFADRMRHLDVELRVGPVMAELDKLRDQIAHERDAAKRQVLVQQYARTSAKLDVPTARLAASERLKAALAAN